MVSIDDSVVQWRDGAGGRAGSPLLVAMHGVGSHERDLFALAPHLPSEYTVASLRGPRSYGDGFAWAEAGVAGATDRAVIDASVEAVLAWLDRQPTAFSRVGLLGFSQGGVMALQLARTRPDDFDFVVQLSGFVHAGAHDGDAALLARSPRMPAFQAVGIYDDIIPRYATDATTAWMRTHFALEHHEYPMAHQVVEPELGDIVAFLRARLAG